MPLHYNDTSCLTLQIRDRLRDLLEADPLVEPLKLSEIHAHYLTDVTESEFLRVSLSYPGGDTEPVATGTHMKRPLYLLCVQRYLGRSNNGKKLEPGEKSDGDVTVALDHCTNVTETILLAMMKYQSDQLYEELTFLKHGGIGTITQYDVFPGKFAYSLTYFQAHAYQLNPG